VRSAIILRAEDNERRAAALEWLDQRTTVYDIAAELGGWQPIPVAARSPACHAPGWRQLHH
jgi:hypothetical protein